MFRTLHRTRGANTVGASKPGDVGPFGIRPPDLDEDDGGGLDDEQHDDEEVTP